MYCTACIINKYQIQRTAYVSAEKLKTLSIHQNSKFLLDNEMKA